MTAASPTRLRSFETLSILRPTSSKLHKPYEDAKTRRDVQLAWILERNEFRAVYGSPSDMVPSQGTILKDACCQRLAEPKVQARDVEGRRRRLQQ